MNTSSKNTLSVRAGEPTCRSLQIGLVSYLLVANFCLSVLSSDSRDIPSVWSLTVTLAAALMIVGLMHAAFRFLVSEPRVPELLLAAMTTFVVGFGWFSHLLLPTVAISPPACFAIWSLTFLILFLTIAKFRGGPANSLILPGYILCALLVMQSGQIGYALGSDMMQLRSSRGRLEASDRLPVVSDQAVSAALPDIYFLIFDAYARADVLADVYDYDNEPFLDELRKRGFYVGDLSRSNYHLTELSLAATLNLDYLQEFDLTGFRTRMPVHRMIDNSTVGRFLKSKGYQTVALESGKNHTKCLSFDRFLTTGFGLDDYQDALLSASAIYPLLELAKSILPTPADLHRNRLRNSFDRVQSVGDEQAPPKFIFSHMLSPHPPFVFDRAGQSIRRHGPYLLADGWDLTWNQPKRIAGYRKLYREQLQYINSEILNLVDNILSGGRPTIIILQSDHGPRSEFDVAEGSHSNFREGFGILNAIFLNGRTSTEVYPTMSSVNTFRAVLNHQFNTSLDRLEDRSWFESGAWDFEDVTELTLSTEKFDLPSQRVSATSNQNQNNQQSAEN